MISGTWWRLGRSGQSALLLLVGLGVFAAPLAGQSTRAERTGYRETSSYLDVVTFLDSLRARGAKVRQLSLGSSPAGHPIPCVVASRPLVGGPAEARRSGKPIVYIQANIHAGEVEGKEAAQMLLRDLTLDSLAPLLDSLVLLVVPIYNVDGNEALAPADTNRPGQNGPAMVGRRSNGQGLDLNRDYVKMEAPETRGSAELLHRWRPDLFLDLHTTNGSYHGYALTFSPGLNPNRFAAGDWVRDRLLPAVRERMHRRHGEATFWYGNFRNQQPDSLVQGWETYDARPRFGTNWVGLRGGMPVLSEAYSNDDFRSRVRVTYEFVREVLSLAAQERRVVLALRGTSTPRPDSIAVRSRLAPPTTREIVAELTAPAGEGNGGYARRRRTGVYRTIPMPVYDRFEPARREALPEAYLIPARLHQVVALLRRQQVEVARLQGPARGRAERFLIDSVSREPPFEGHRPARVEGRWQPAAPAVLEPGWYLVPTRQPLGILAAYLLEPASEDGVVTWNLLDAELRAGGSYPILRSREAIRAQAQPIQ